MQMIFRFWENLKMLYHIAEKKKWCLGVLLCLQPLLCGLYNDDSTSLLATPTLPTAIPGSRFHFGFQLTSTPDSRFQVRFQLTPIPDPRFRFGFQLHLLFTLYATLVFCNTQFLVFPRYQRRAKRLSKQPISLSSKPRYIVAVGKKLFCFELTLFLSAALAFFPIKYIKFFITIFLPYHLYALPQI